MPLKTDLNVTPYFDDYSAANNFQQILARPGQAIQARELTQLQSILRNQSEKLGDFLLQEGTVVIPGNLKLSQNIDTIKLIEEKLPELEKLRKRSERERYGNSIIKKVFGKNDNGLLNYNNLEKNCGQYM